MRGWGRDTLQRAAPARDLTAHGYRALLDTHALR